MNIDLLNSSGIDIPVELRPTVATASGLLQELTRFRADPTAQAARALADAWDGYRKVFACCRLADSAWQAYRDRTGLAELSAEDDALKQKLCDNAALDFAHNLLGELSLAEQMPAKPPVQALGRRA